MTKRLGDFDGTVAAESRATEDMNHLESAKTKGRRADARRPGTDRAGLFDASDDRRAFHFDVDRIAVEPQVRPRGDVIGRVLLAIDDRQMRRAAVDRRTR